jgi:adenine/guanine phosphoribosyltransferase-like PRPP-binding protein
MCKSCNRLGGLIAMFDLLGKEVATLVSQELGAGYYSVRWQANVASGTYVYRLQAGEFAETRRMILLL